MIPYKDINGDSNIESFEIGPNFIIVKFYGTRKFYKYSDISAGKFHVDETKRLAKLGNGLNSYINKHCKDKYEQ